MAERGFLQSRHQCKMGNMPSVLGWGSFVKRFFIGTGCLILCRRTNDKVRVLRRIFNRLDQVFVNIGLSVSHVDNGGCRTSFGNVARNAILVSPANTFLLLEWSLLPVNLLTKIRLVTSPKLRVHRTKMQPLGRASHVTVRQKLTVFINYISCLISRVTRHLLILLVCNTQGPKMGVHLTASP